MLRLSVIKSCFVFPDGVSLTPGWDGGHGVVVVASADVLAVKVSGPLQNRAYACSSAARAAVSKTVCPRFESWQVCDHPLAHCGVAEGDFRGIAET